MSGSSRFPRIKSAKTKQQSEATASAKNNLFAIPRLNIPPPEMPDIKTPRTEPLKTPRVAFKTPTHRAVGMMSPKKSLKSPTTARSPAPAKSKPLKNMTSRKIHQLLGDEKDASKMPNRKNFLAPEIYYFDKGLGHLAIKIIYQVDNKWCEKYFSYGRDGSSNESSLENEIKIYGKNYFKLVLHKTLTVTDALMLKASLALENKDRASTYNKLSDNCMHAVLQFLKIAGYPLTDSQIKKLTLPSSGMVFLSSMDLQFMQDARAGLCKQHAPADDKASVGLIKSLIQNDKERLNVEMMLSNIEWFSSRNSSNIQFQLIQLEKLSEMLNRMPIDFPRTFEWLCASYKVTDNTTATHLMQCIQFFPVNQLPEVEKKREFITSFVKEILKEKHSPIEVRNWVQNISHENFAEVSPLSVHFWAYEAKQLLVKIAKNTKAGAVWVSTANDWLQKLDPNAVVANARTPRPPRAF